MKSLYSAPLRVYLLLFCLALAGIYAGLGLPVSLFPNSSKPKVGVWLNYGNYTPDEFLHAYGASFEEQLRSISTEDLQVSDVKANYRRGSVRYEVKFDWGSPPMEARREVETVANGFAARFPSEIRDSMGIWNEGNGSGFMAVSFYSPTRSLDEVYHILDPILSPRLAKVPDADTPELYNPSHKDVQVEINPERMASLQLLPKDISQAIEEGLYGSGGGSFASQAQQYSIQMPRALQNLDDLARLPVRSSNGTVTHLGDVAHIDYATSPGGSRSFKTNGNPSIILFAQPKAGGNIKKMSEDILDVIRNARSTIPSDIQYKVLVDPSEFIRSAIHNVMREVLVGGLLAVAVLFLFVGSLKNTATAAIEIPMSMILAFIPMKFFGMNLNLISLGGLALSAGMNVDASVVVMENIFRHFEEAQGPIDARKRLDILVRSVREVRFPVIASTVASLVVFIPLAFTSKLTNAILGDLAKTVVFSHGFSAFVALILVPTVRLQLMSKQKEHKPIHSPIEPWIRKLESAYGRALAWFLDRPKVRLQTYGGLIATLILLLVFVLPRLPKEVIGKPDTDWITINITGAGNTLFREMESQASEFESQLLKDFGSHIQYTFTQIEQVNSAVVMARLKDKSEMRSLWKAMEAKYANTPMLRYDIDSWNPAELPIPNPPQIQLSVQGGTLEARAAAAEDLKMRLEEKQVLPRIHTEPDLSHSDEIVLRPNLDRWASPSAAKLGITPSDLADMVRVATSGKPASIQMPINGDNVTVTIRYPSSYIRTPEDIGALPVGIDGKLMPLRGLMNVSVEEAKPPIYRENGRDVFHVIARANASSEGHSSDTSYIKRAHKIVSDWEKQAPKDHPVVTFDQVDKDLTDALHQLGTAVGLSILLIFVTLVLQFGSLVNALLVLVAIPLGLIGVLGSLFVFGSTLSLNSVLGVILLNGISVANSIILVDFQKMLFDRGLSPAQAAIEAGKKRLRPILITSLTTILAMLPVAFGIGEGGRILQPLGIAVAGGLWVSMGFTLFIVPALQTSYLSSRWAKRTPVEGPDKYHTEVALSESTLDFSPLTTSLTPGETGVPELMQ